MSGKPNKYRSGMLLIKLNSSSVLNFVQFYKNKLKVKLIPLKLQNKRNRLGIHFLKTNNTLVLLKIISKHINLFKQIAVHKPFNSNYQ